MATKASTATLGSSFKCVHVNGLSQETISTIRTAYQPDYTNDSDEINDLFRVDGLLEMLEQLEEEPTDHPDGLTPEDYRAAIDELEAVPGLKEFDYISIALVD